MRFWFHFNKNATRIAGGEARISLHFGRACHIVRNIACAVPTVGRIRKRQPKFVMTGEASKIEIAEGIARIT